MHLDDVITDGYAPDFEDTFASDVLDKSHWLPNYLPHWSSVAASAARYELADGCLHLLIEADQQPWCPEFDGSTRVSSLQTGVFSGRLGSSIGQHRFNAAAVVREAQQSLRLYTPQFGVFVLRAKAIDDLSCMVSLWMIGYEDHPERSAEICICEIFGKNVESGFAAIGMGLHPFGDPTIRDDFTKVRLPIDVREFHEYAAEWLPDRVTFFIDGRPVRTVNQAPKYPMQLMLGIYEFGEPASSNRPYPKRFTIDSFRGYRPVATT